MAKLSKKQFKELGDKLTRQPKSVWEKASAAQRKAIMAMGESYKAFLDAAKTERLAVGHIMERAAEAGFEPLTPGAGGQRLMVQYRGKAAALLVRGQRPAAQGLRIIGSHIDAPRLDLKQNPLYEDHDLVFLKTHYYGGIKKYHWLARPLAIHGVVCLADGGTTRIDLGERPDDPVFTVMDLLPHLSRKLQEGKKLGEAFEAERMNVVLAGLPVDSDEKGDKVKLAVLQRLHDDYGVTEDDFVSAELEVVPAGPARDVGLDRALIGGYGQDDRAASYCLLEAMLALQEPACACLAVFVDKEEVGSEGATSAQSHWLEHLAADLLELEGGRQDYLAVMRALAGSQCLSADANAAFDPDYPEVHEKLNAAYLGHGACLSKYTGHGGKYSANDADAEYVAWLRNVWDAAGAPWQAAGMGKVDQGGGGTIAKHLAAYGMDVVDVGPPLLSMHSPFEISHKADIWAVTEAYRAFFEARPWGRGGL